MPRRDFSFRFCGEDEAPLLTTLTAKIDVQPGHGMAWYGVMTVSIGGIESFSCNVKNEVYGNQPIDGLLLFLACHEAWRYVALRGFACVKKARIEAFAILCLSVRSNVDEVLV